jgi:HPt (histidine-containing phosphotransfer) domain-containing protein
MHRAKMLIKEGRGCEMQNNCRKLIEMGIDAGSVINRLGGNEVLYLAICRKFINDPTYNLLKEALQNKDAPSAQLYIHTLKGIAANLGFIRLELISKSLSENIHSKDYVATNDYFDCLTMEYQQIITTLTDMSKQSTVHIEFNS